MNAAHALAAQPRFGLARLPTPLHEAARLRAALGGEDRCPRIFLKRDDLTDLALGGNKARKLEFLVADAMRARATVLITTGAVQSNHARMTAAAARRAGMRAVLVLTSPAGPADLQGNLLLDRILGAEVHIIDGVLHKGPAAGEREEQIIAALREQLEREGERPYVVALGGSCAIGTLGYVDCTREMLEQLASLGMAPTRLYYASGSRGTQAGLELGARAFHAPWQCTGIAVSGGEAEKRERAVDIARAAARRLEIDLHVAGGDFVTDQEWYGEGYAIPTAAGVEAMQLLAATEGILLDPVYTAKAMSGLIGHIRSGRIPPDETVLFLHTGGAPGLFGAASAIAPLLHSPAAERNLL
jgi:D-cysteine desulfhydrase family pyridoxal phosphate-dependent enzyme